MELYKSIDLDKAMYRAGGSFTGELERLDPTDGYAGSELAGLDAFQRQLKRFDIRVSGAHSDAVSKFFSTASSACLFPEYVARAVGQGMNDAALIDAVIATKTNINSLDYRSLTADISDDDKLMPVVAEGAEIPEVELKLSDKLVKLTKRGRMLVASYEALRFQRLDLVTVLLGQIGAHIARAQLRDAVAALLEGEVAMQSAGAELSYADLLKLWGAFGDYEMNTLVCSPAMVQRLLALPEMRDATAGLSFHATGKLATPLGAAVVKTAAVADDTIIALDKRFALEMVTAGGVNVDYDKLINCQLERAAVTATAGFAKIIPEAVQVMKLKA